jgi:hypothetical protein
MPRLLGKGFLLDVGFPLGSPSFGDLGVSRKHKSPLSFTNKRQGTPSLSTIWHRNLQPPLYTQEIFREGFPSWRKKKARVYRA